MNKHHSILATVSTLACVATLTLSGCSGGGGGGSSTTAAFCNDYSEVASVASNPATPQAVAFFDKVEGEAPSAIKADVKTVATNARNMLNDDVAGVDTHAMQAAGDRIDNYASSACPSN